VDVKNAGQYFFESFVLERDGDRLLAAPEEPGLQRVPIFMTKPFQCELQRNRLQGEAPGYPAGIRGGVSRLDVDGLSVCLQRGDLTGLEDRRCTTAAPRRYLYAPADERDPVLVFARIRFHIDLRTQYFSDDAPGRHAEGLGRV